MQPARQSSIMLYLDPILIFFISLMSNIPSNSADPLSAITETHHRDTLYRQIETYRSKLSEYQLLQKEFNQITIHINAAQATKPQPHNKSLKSKSSADKSMKPGNAKRNSHKKVKIYELQKKLEKVSRQNAQRRLTHERNSDSHNKILWGIDELSTKIQEEKQTSANLKSLYQQIQSELQSNSSKLQQQLKRLEESVRLKESCNFQKKQIRENINRTRALILNLTNNLTEQLSFSSSDEAINSNPTVSLSLDNSFNHKHRNAVTQMPLWFGRQTKRIQGLIDKHEIDQQKSIDQLQEFYRQKKQLVSNQILVKHHKLTISLYASKIKEYQKIIRLYKNSMEQRASSIHAISQKMQRLQGESGYLRGRIGMTIEQQRLTKSLNILLEADRDKARQKCHYLSFLLKILQKKAY